jgi:RecA DNA recombination protein
VEATAPSRSRFCADGVGFIKSISTSYIRIISALTIAAQIWKMGWRTNGEMTRQLPTLPIGAITEILGAISSGRTSLTHSILADATERGEFCALVDPLGAFDPQSAAQAGVDLRRLLWVRGNAHIDHALKAADLILHSGGFGVIVLDLCEVAVRDLNRIPLSYWYRFRRAVENTPAMFIVASQHALVKSCARMQLEVRRERVQWRGPLFNGIDSQVQPRKLYERLVG